MAMRETDFDELFALNNAFAVAEGVQKVVAIGGGDGVDADGGAQEQRRRCDFEAVLVIRRMASELRLNGLHARRDTRTHTNSTPVTSSGTCHVRR